MNLNPKSSKPVLVCAFGLLAAFFMPWVQLLGASMSGYNLGQLGSYGNYAWVIPILAGATILLSFSGMNNRAIGAVSGIIPLAAVFYFLVRIAGEGGGRATQGVIEVAGHILSIGAWLTIIFSIAIIIAAFVQTARQRKSSDGITVYVNPKNQEEYLELKADGSFERRTFVDLPLMKFLTARGEYEINANVITFKLESAGAFKGMLEGDTFIDERGGRWQKQ